MFGGDRGRKGRDGPGAERVDGPSGAAGEHAQSGGVTSQPANAGQGGGGGQGAFLPSANALSQKPIRWKYKEKGGMINSLAKYKDKY